MKAVITTREDGILNIGATPAGRAAAALERFVFVVPLIVIGGGIFFLPDYLGRYREQEPVPGFLLAALVITAVFIGLVASVLRYFRDDLWVVDANERMLVYQTSRVLGSGVEHTGIELDMIERFVAEIDESWGDSGLYVQVEGHGHERMLESRTGADSFGQVADVLRDFLSEKGLEIPVEIERK